ncbi:hypothetical protein EDD11_009787 [Mortierella claussenii]|nr:hypothetical protein EDD11_009787 [Mortierella claussenii]
MALGFLTRPRSKKRCIILFISALLLWMYSSSSGINLPDYFSRPTIYSQTLDHLNKPLCPRFYKYDRQKLMMLEPNECTPVKSEHPDFSADICFSPYTCNEGLVRVRRRDRTLCKEANLRYPISGNATHDAFHRQFSGPDAFHVVFSGAEKLAPPDWYHAGQCLYVFPFHISNPGRLFLDIIHLYDNFDAVVEENEHWPVLKQQNVVSHLPLEICRGCPSRVIQPRFPILLSDGPESEERLLNPTETDKEEEEDAVVGAWLPARPEDRQSWRKASYTWTPLGCTYGKPLQRSCLQGKKDALKVLFQGDSQLQVAMEQLVRRLGGSNEIQTSIVPSANGMEETFGATTFTFVSDPLFSNAVVGEPNLLVVNVGQWATGTKFLDSLMSTAQYHDKILGIVESIQQKARDQQDMEDEDFEDEDNGDGSRYSGDEEYEDEYGREEDEDEYDLENEREVQRQENQLEGAAEFYWDDETEEEQSVQTGSPKKNRPGAAKDVDRENEQEVDEEGEQRQQEDDDDDRRGGQEDGGKPMPRYPPGRFMRQSKHIRLPGQRQSAPILGTAKDETGYEQPEPHHRYAEQKEAVLSDKPQLAKDDIVDDKINRGSGSKSSATSSKVHPMATQPRTGRSRGTAVDRGRPSISGSRRPTFTGTATLKSSHSNNKSSRGGSSRSTGSQSQRGSSTNHHPERPVSKSNRDSSDSNKSDSTTAYRMARRSLDDIKIKTKITHGTDAKKSIKIRRRSLQDLTKIVWAGMVAFPETQPADPMFHHDWRTLYRLRYWNQIAEDVMLLHNVPFMDFFSMTLSMLDTSPDRSHYFGNDAAEAMLEELAFKLGLCENDDN